MVDGAGRNEWAPLTALEVSQHIQAAFDSGQATVQELLAAAFRSRARPVVFGAIHRLPRRRFRSVMDVLHVYDAQGFLDGNPGWYGQGYALTKGDAAPENAIVRLFAAPADPRR